MTVHALANPAKVQALDLPLEQKLDTPAAKERRHNLHESVDTTRSRSQQAFARGVNNTLTAQHLQQKFNAKFAVSPSEQFGGGDTLGSKAEKIFANLRQLNGGRAQLSELGDISDAALIEAGFPDDGGGTVNRRGALFKLVNRAANDQSYLESRNRPAADVVDAMLDRDDLNNDDLLQINRFRSKLVGETKAQYMAGIFSPENVGNILFLASTGLGTKLRPRSFRYQPRTTSPRPNASNAAVNISHGTKIPTVAEEAALLGTHSSKVGNFSGLYGKSINEVLKRIPKGASRRQLTPQAGKVTEGFEYKWTQGGKTWRARIHGPDASAPAGTNSASGWSFRLQQGSKYMDDVGNFHPRNVHNAASPHYNPAAGNATHIPLQGNSILSVVP